MQALFDDVRFAARMFARRRRFATLLVATIALGIGSATSIFSLVDTVLWRPLPYRDVDRLYWVARTDESWRASPVLASVWNNMGHTLPDYHDWAGAQRSFEATGAWFVSTGVLGTSDGTEQIAVGRATASLTPLLGTRPALGRWFLPGEDVRDGRRLAVLSFESWQRRFGGDSAVIGRRLTLNGEPVRARSCSSSSPLPYCSSSPAGTSQRCSSATPARGTPRSRHACRSVRRRVASSVNC